MGDQKLIRPNPKDEPPERPSDAQDHALSDEESLEEGLMDSMDGSDPASSTQPSHHGEPVPSSGFHEEEEEEEIGDESDS